MFPTSFGRCWLDWAGTSLTGFRLPEEGVGVDVVEDAFGTGLSDATGGVPPWIVAVTERVKLHFDGKLQDFSDLPLDWPRVSDFQKAVYLRTQAIKPGFKKSYGEISRAMNLGPEGARAVGAALAANPWPLIVPCHRVVSASDRMTGFSAPGGIRSKTRLLVLEGAELLSE